MQSKKGVVELGINSIIILILALVFLGIAIIFIVNIFNRPLPESPGFPFKPTSDDPLIFEKSQVEVRAGAEADLRLKVYNKDFAEDELVRATFDRCEREGVIEYNLKFSTAAQAIIPGEDATFLGVVSATPEVALGTYTCTVIVADEGMGNLGPAAQVYVLVSR